MDRPRTQPFAQALLLLATLIIAACIFAIDPTRFTPWFWLAVAVIAAGTVTIVIVFRFPPEKGTSWLAIIALVDILAIVPIRHSSFDVLPVAGILCIFPVGWLAFAFPIAPIVVSLFLSVLISGSSIFLGGSFPSTFAEWAQVLALPVLLGLFAAATYVVSTDWRVQRGRLLEAQDTIAGTLRSAGRDYAMLKTIADTTPDAVIVFDLDGEPLLSNLAAARYAAHAGIPVALGRDVVGHVYGADARTVLRLERELLTDIIEGRFTGPQRVWIGPPGDQLALSFFARPVFENGAPVAVVAVANDVTDYVHAVEVRDRFLDEVGHELRTPLTVILGNADLTLDDVSGRPRERIVAIQRSAERLLELVQRLLDAGKSAIEAHGGTSDLSDAVTSTISALEPEAVTRDVAVRHSVAASTHVDIETKALIGILTELVRNAIHATPPGMAVVITAQTRDETIRLEILDRGPGMSPEEIRRAFDRFYRTDRARSQAIPGAGLGLTLAANLAAAHSAKITLESIDTVGLRATVHLTAAARRTAASIPHS